MKKQFEFKLKNYAAFDIINTYLLQANKELKLKKDEAESLIGNNTGSDTSNTQNPETRTHPKIGRNEPCPCGSGKKFKVCHGK